MKKILTFLSMLIFGIGIANAQLTATLALPDMGIQPAGTVTTPLTVPAVGGGDNFGTFQIFIVYDPLIVTPLAVNFTNPSMPFYEWSNNLAYGPNEIILTWLSFSSGHYVTPGEELCTIDWDFIGVPAYTSLTFNTVGDEVPGWPEKGMTAVWSSFGTQYTLTLNDGSIGAGIPPTTWTGAVSDDWDDPLNWTFGIPTSITPATNVQAGMPFDPVIYGSAMTESLNVNVGASLNIDAYGDLSTFGLFTCDGHFEIMTENANGYAGSYIDFGGLAGGGMFYFTRNMLCTGIGGGSVDPLGWHYLAAPIDGFSTDDLTDYYVNQWDEPSSMWLPFEGSEPCAPYAPAESLDVLEAWSINYASDWNCPGGTGLDLEFLGPFVNIHTGPHSAPATYTGGAHAGWNMFGNPYPSGLDMNAIVWDPNAVPGAAYYDGCTGNYVYWTPALGAYTMAPGLGFFTEWTAPGTFTLSGNERAHTPDIFWETDVDDLLTIKITDEEKSDFTHIRFMEEAEAGFAKDGDFHKLFTQGIPQIYTTAGDDKLAVNARPATPIVPLGMTATESGTYTISVVEASDFETVFLEDLYSGNFYNLFANPYTFEYMVGDEEIRFLIHYILGNIDDNLKNLVNIWSNHGNIYVQVPDVSGDIVVFNMMGQEVVRTNIEPGINIIPMKAVNTYHVVKVVTNDSEVTGKVFIK